MSDMIRLRDYQDEAIKALFDAWINGMMRPAVVLPTGAGKTVVFSHVVRDFHRWRTACDGQVIGNGGARCLILVHRDELADQAIDKIRQTAPDLSVGKVKADCNEIDRTIMVASVQTLSRSSRLEDLLNSAALFGDIGLIITDECHHAAAPSYRKIYDAFPDAVNAGFSATLVRGDGVGLGSVWDDVVYSKSVLWMISRNYLVDVRGQGVRLDQLELSKVKKSAGDYQAKALGSAMVAADSPRVIAAALRRYAPGRRSVVFCPDVESAYQTMKVITASGIEAGWVHGKMPPEQRRANYRAFQDGSMPVLVNCMVLTEGWDAPWADCAVIARPTQSPALYQQMVGRVLRPFPGKSDALVLDVTGTGGRLSTLIDLAPGEVDAVRSGETLADAAIRYETEQNTVYKADSIAFALKHRDMDLFAGSSKSWLRTDGGVLFLPVSAGFVFLWPSADGRWDVGAAPARGKWRRLHTNLPLGTAQAWAETEADELTAYKSRNADKSNTWRKEPATGPMIGRAVRYGFWVGPGATRGEVSDLIAIGEASLKLDPEMRKIK